MATGGQRRGVGDGKATRGDGTLPRQPPSYMCHEKALGIDFCHAKEAHRCNDRTEPQRHASGDVRGERALTKNICATCYGDDSLVPKKEVLQHRQTGGKDVLPMCRHCFDLGTPAVTSAKAKVNQKKKAEETNTAKRKRMDKAVALLDKKDRNKFSADRFRARIQQMHCQGWLKVKEVSDKSKQTRARIRKHLQNKRVLVVARRPATGIIKTLEMWQVASPFDAIVVCNETELSKEESMLAPMTIRFATNSQRAFSIAHRHGRCLTFSSVVSETDHLLDPLPVFHSSYSIDNNHPVSLHQNAGPCISLPACSTGMSAAVLVKHCFGAQYAAVVGMTLENSHDQLDSCHLLHKNDVMISQCVPAVQFLSS